MLARKALAGTAGAPKEYVEDVFSTYLTVGNGTTTTITNNIDLSGKGGLVWLKDRTGAGWHSLGDTERSGKRLFSNDTSAESSSYPFSFTSSGFTANGNLLDSGRDFVSWTFRKAKKFFDVVTYTGNGTAGRTVSHNLGSTPGCIIIKRTNTAKDWAVYHRSRGKTEYGLLNSTAAFADDAGDGRWNDTDPTSTVFTLGTDSEVNANGDTYVAYLFAHDAGGFGDAGSDNVITCGSYTGNGSTSGPTVTLGYEPQWLMIKASSTTGSWQMIDNMRGMVVGGNEARLIANSSSAELSNDYLSPTATGFQLVSTSSEVNGNGQTYIYIAIRRGPMKTPTVGTSVFAIDTLDGTTLPAFVSGFPVDMAIQRYNINTVDDPQVATRLLQATQLLTNSTAAETSASLKTFDFNNGYDSRTGTSSNWYSWMFRRAPGFFDVVCYTGTGSNRTVSHNLGVAPELIIIKRRSSVNNWLVYNAISGNQAYLLLNDTGAVTTGASTVWNSTSPTSSVFSLGTNATGNASGETYVAYLFASLSGVSKVGSYTGNGSSVTVTTDFQPRFILVKRYDSTGNWIVGDSARGLVSADEPALFLNSTAAETTGQDWVDVSSTGFTVNETALNANVNTATYIYLAIA